MKHAGEYWCYCTGLEADGRAFPILHSLDLVHWRRAGTALDRLAPGTLPVPDLHYWAPEVVYFNGHFYLYYSAGNEVHMQIRVAVADHPAGPFVDSGHRLTSEDFAIDAHVFADDDGTRYLFYATDFLEHTHIGTGTVVDRMRSPFALEGQPRPVTRARYDWQVYDPQRRDKGGVRWHTVEGPFVLKRKGRYYQMFSGGNWQNVTYGVSYAVSPDVVVPDEWQQVSDGERVLPILRSRPAAGVVGPGHNSVVRGPDNRQLFCIYHRWDRASEARVLAIDRMEWVGEALRVLGPSTGPQPAPLLPAVSGFGPDRRIGLHAPWETLGGQWSVRQGRAHQTTAAPSAAARLHLPAPAFLFEVNLAASAVEHAAGGRFGSGARGRYGVSLEGEQGELLRVHLIPRESVISIALGTAELRHALPDEFAFGAEHHLRLEVNGPRVYLALDDNLFRWTGQIAPPNALTLFTQDMAATFAGPTITVGWEDNFADPGSPEAWGWRNERAEGEWQVAGRALRQIQPEARGAVLAKGPSLNAYEFVVNARLERLESQPALVAYGFYPAYAGPRAPGPLLTVELGEESAWQVTWRPGTAPHELDPGQSPVAGRHLFPLPREFDPYVDQQFRFRRENGQISLQWGAMVLGGIQAPPRPNQVALYAHRAVAAFDMVRVTALR